MSKYTPGPWEFDSHGGCFYVWGPKGEMIADGDTDEGYITRMRGVGRGATEEEQGANARLIAAAPDLLEACKAVKATCPADPDINPEWQAAWDLLLAATAKAEEPAR